ncbi:mitochondrial carrier, partial [Piptocephalis cylindrospora]
PSAPSVNGFHNFLAGSVAGMAQVVAGHPLDTIKTRLQLPGTHFRGAIDCVTQTVRQEGLLALYKGMGTPFVGISAVNALLFASYSRLKAIQVPEGSLGTLALYQIALAGAGAGAINSILVSPVELVKVRLQAQYSHRTTSARYTGPIDCVKNIFRESGWRRGIFRGFHITVLREIPGNAGFYAGFEGMKRALSRTKGTGEAGASTLGPASLVFSGACGGISYWTACYPLDVIKSHAQHMDGVLGPKYILDIARNIYREGGILGFYRGFTSAVLRGLPAAAATFTTFEL